MSKLREIFCTCYMWPWFYFSLTTTQYKLCTSCFVDGVVFSHNTALCGVLRDLRPRDISQRKAMQRRAKLQRFSSADLCITFRVLTSIAVSLAVHNRVWLWRRTVRYALVRSLLSLTALPNSSSESSSSFFFVQ